jgi:hypothetical protein
MQDELQRMYDSEINVRIESFWDGDWKLVLGDQLNGFIERDGTVQRVEDIVPAPQGMIRKHFPDSKYARQLA